MANFKTLREIRSDSSEIRFPINTVIAEGKSDQIVSSPEIFGKMKVLSASFEEGKISKLFIKNMVSSRCVIVVKAVLQHLDLHCIRVDLGAAYISGNITNEQWQKLNAILLKSGLELISDHKEALVEKIKNVLIEMIYYSDELPQLKISRYLSSRLNYNYTYLANIFSETKHLSITQFIIDRRIERVKEMLIYENLTLSEIAHKLNYSSVAYLSRQFKKHTGQMPSYFRKVNGQKRSSLRVCTVEKCE